ncbi:hypothetical protein MAR_011211 [Mya arenaria]|uniref:Uncharacterized protein n=1 Tax=Mya arenaria TaxID=6604 RepID=A0ABY7FTM0_MYAAR|nr:hypothetical protein MAR_011211 [Mya arenaria]
MNQGNQSEVNETVLSENKKDETCRYTCLENSDTTKDITPVSVYMTGTQGLFCNNKAKQV